MAVAAVRSQPPLKLGNAALRSRKRRGGFITLGGNRITLSESSVTIRDSLGKSRRVALRRMFISWMRCAAW